VLIIAEAANPEWTSVPLIGWSLSQALAKVTDVHLVTHVRNRDAIVRQGLLEGRDFTAIDNEKIASPLYSFAEKLRGGSGKGWTTSTAFSSIAYYSFEAETWRQFSGRIHAGEFDLVHRITPLSPTSQSLIAKRLAKIGVPFIIGPLNGGLPWPPNFKGRQYAEREWLSSVRWLYKLMPAYRSTRRFSSRIIVGSQFTYQDMPNWAKSKCVYVPENGVDFEKIGAPRSQFPSTPLRAAFVGRLVAYKGVDVLLEAAKDVLINGKLDLHIIGDGPERRSLGVMTKTLGIESAVRFHGWLPHSEAQQKLGACDMLILPSIREFGGGVVVEAMALGVPPLVADYGGPAELVDDTTGIKVQFTDKQSLVDGMRGAIELIVGSPALLSGLGFAARKKVVETLTWAAKANQICRIYDDVLGA
jgi:glycosyltransferase involved in cell wall biosynthesis